MPGIMRAGGQVNAMGIKDWSGDFSPWSVSPLALSELNERPRSRATIGRPKYNREVESIRGRVVSRTSQVDYQVIQVEFVGEPKVVVALREPVTSLEEMV